MNAYVPLVLALVYGPLGLILILYGVGLLLRARGRPQLLDWLVRQTRYERD